MPTPQGWRSGPPEVPISRLKAGSRTIAASSKANMRGIISQGPAVLLMAQPPIAACLVAARIYFFFVFSELPMCFFALQCFHSDLHLESSSSVSHSLLPQDLMAPCFPTLLSLPPAVSLLWATDSLHGHTRWEMGTEGPVLIACFWKPKMGI